MTAAETDTADTLSRDGLLPPPEHPIRLPAFEGPLDLLLYLIRKNEIDIYDIPIETVTRQYLEMLRTYERNNLEFAGDFFVMAATLMYIKSRMLLPAEIAPAADPDAESDAAHDLDPRWELVQQLIQYKKTKESAGKLEELIAERQSYLARLVSTMPETPDAKRALAPTDRIELWNTFNHILQRLSDRIAPGEIHGETVTISSRMEEILARLGRERRFTFTSLLPENPSIAVLVSSFLACLELARLGKLFLSQSLLFDEIYCDAEAPGEAENAAPSGGVASGEGNGFYGTNGTNETNGTTSPEQDESDSVGDPHATPVAGDGDDTSPDSPSPEYPAAPDSPSFDSPSH
jgi:segregation and condensation protein A